MTEKPTPLSLENGQSCLSRVFFLWVNELLTKGNQKPLEIDDLYDVMDHEKIAHIIEKDDQMSAQFPKDTLIQNIIRQTKPQFIIATFLSLTSGILQFAGPIFLNMILLYLQNDEMPNALGYIFAILMFICLVCRSFIDQHSKNICSKVGFLIINRIYYRLFKKLLTLSTASKKYYDMGKINTIILMNAEELRFFFMFLPILISAPLIIVLATIYIIIQVGPIGLIAPPLLYITSWSINKMNILTVVHRISMMGLSGQRSKLTNEFLQGMRILKYYAWEKFVTQSFQGLRLKELSLCKEIASLRGLIEALSIAQGPLISIAIFGVLVAVGTQLKTSMVFTVIALLNMMVVISYFNDLKKKFPIKMIIMGNQMYLSAKAAFLRIDALLKGEDIEPVPIVDDAQWGISFSVKDANLSWESFEATKQFEKNKILFNMGPGSAAKPQAVKQEAKNQYEKVTETLTTEQKEKESEIITMKNINLNIRQGELIAVIGQVGSGKSSFLSALLGDMNIINGSVQYQGSIAYISQNVWLRNSTLRDNITFGFPFEQERYNHVIQICQLEDDLKALPGGDMTEVGERGVNLSGGQKQRISIARAIYSQSDNYLIDDCLSALDSYVGKRIFHNVIEQELKGKTRIVVTHQLNYMKFFDRIFILQNGEIVEIDTFSNMQNNPNSKMKTLKVELKKQKENEDEDEENVEGNIQQVENNNNNNALQLNKKKSSIQIHDKEPTKKDQQTDQKKALEGQMIMKEEQSKGNVPWEVYKFYFAQGGSVQMLISVLTFFLSQAVRQLTDWWLAMWSNNIYPLDQGQYIGIYALFIVLAIFLFWLRFKIFSEVTTKSSKNIFEKLIIQILHAPLSWFDVTPIGRVITRCTKNIDDIDYTLSILLQFSLFFLVTILSTFIMISIITPFFTIICVVMVIYYIFLIRYYLKTAREIKRIIDIAKAPLIGVIQEASQGAHIIRPFKRQQFYLSRFMTTCDSHTISLFHEQWCQRWITIRSEFFGSLIIFATALLGVSSRGTSQAALIGVSLTWAVGISGMLPYLVDILAQTETMMNSVQRVHTYVTTLPQERAYEQPKPPQNWPTQGQFTIRNICFKYREGLENVIHSISFDIKGKEKIGIIGRTGSGKSTMTLGLLRILELSTDENGHKGSILLDGINLEDVGLEYVRSNISIIPQDPVLFSGELRKNIDPFNKYKDQEIIECLRKVQLEEILQTRLAQKDKQENTKVQQNIEVDPDQNKNILNIKIEESGSNFSLGEKQLICMARALIRKPQVLLMDEATASIDEKTDHIIQKMIKTEFKNSTVITIAHRLNTIIQYNKVLILALGKIQEYESPIELLKKPESYLTKLVSEHGPEYFKHMKMLAENPDIDA